MSDSEYQSARAQLLVIRGVTGVAKSASGRGIIVYVESDSVSIPNSIGSFTIIKKVSGKIGLM